FERRGLAGRHGERERLGRRFLRLYEHDAEPPIKPARSIGKKLSPGNFSFPFSRPQSGNSDLVSYRAVSDSYPSLFLGDRSPAKHLSGLSRASAESCPSNPEPHGAFQRRDPTPRRGPE